MPWLWHVCNYSPQYLATQPVQQPRPPQIAVITPIALISLLTGSQEEIRADYPLVAVILYLNIMNL